MNTQFVDLFDRNKYGFNYWAIIFLFLGSAVAWCLVSGWHFAIGDYRMTTPWGQFLLGMTTHWLVFAVLTIGLCHVLKIDLLLPITVGIGIVIWRIVSGFLDMA